MNIDWSWHVSHSAGLQLPYWGHDSAGEADRYANKMRNTMPTPANWTSLAMPLAGGWVPQIQAWVANQLLIIRPYFGPMVKLQRPLLYEALIVIGPSDKELFRATADSERKAADVALRDFSQYHENLRSRVYSSIATLMGVKSE